MTVEAGVGSALLVRVDVGCRQRSSRDRGAVCVLDDAAQGRGRDILREDVQRSKANQRQGDGGYGETSDRRSDFDSHEWMTQRDAGAPRTFVGAELVPARSISHARAGTSPAPTAKVTIN